MASEINNEATIEENIIEENLTEEVSQEAEEKTACGELQAQLDELNQRYIRLVADFDNYRRRTTQEKSELADYTLANMFTRLLPVVDNFERALAAAELNEQIKGYLKGMEMVYTQFLECLNKEGLATIQAVGEPFDPKKHEAIMTVPTDEVEEDTVIEELQKGYTFKDKVIRPTMCKVSAK